MSKHKKHSVDFDDEFFNQMELLQSDYDHALQTVEQQKKDIQKLLALLVERDLPIPGDIIDRYIRRSPEDDSEETEEWEELPFD